MTFAQKLQELRKRAGLSQEEFAEQLGVSRQSVSKWELAQAYPETDKIIEISRIFGVSLDVLLKGDDPSSPEPPRAAPEPPYRRWLVPVLGVLAVLCVAAAGLFFVLQPGAGNAPSAENTPSSQPTEPVSPPGETETPPAETTPPPTETAVGPVDMAVLREYYFDFARRYRLDYVPYFEEYTIPSDSTEYLFWAFAINLDNWGEDKGTMSREYVDNVVLQHFGQDELVHQSMWKGWDFDGETYTAYPDSLKEQPLYLLTNYATYIENGIRYHEITLEYLHLTSGMIPTPEEDAALRERIITGSTDDLYVAHRETLRYHMAVTDPDTPIFDSHLLLSDDI